MSNFYRDKAEVTRLTYVGKKGEYSAIGKSYMGYLKIASDDINSTSKGTYGKSSHFQTAVNADIKESDKLLINGQEYVVGPVTIHRGLRLEFLRALLTSSPGST